MKTLQSILILALFLFGCKRASNSEIAVEALKADSLHVGLRIIQVSKGVEKSLPLDEVFRMKHVIYLSDEIPLNEIKRTIISDGRIYILDEDPKIVCFDMKGNVIFNISNRGGGPKEFSSIYDFTINKEKGALVFYDAEKRKIFEHDLKNGNFQKTDKIEIVPIAVAYVDGTTYYYNPDFHYISEEEKLHYTLLTSDNTYNELKKAFFLHDPLYSAYDFGMGRPFPFYYSKNTILYCNLFETRVFQLSDGDVVERYSIELPNSLPRSFIESHPKAVDFLRSDFSSCLGDVYEMNGLLYFTYSRSAMYVFNIYDLKKNQLIFSDKKLPDPTKEFMFCSIVNGVYENSFFSFVNPSLVDYWESEKPGSVPDALKKFKEDSNPALVFYERK